MSQEKDRSSQGSIAAPSPEDEQRRHALLAAVADPIRLRILSYIRRPRAVRDICEHLGMAQPRISHHLGILRGCGLIQALSTGRMRLYHWATPAGSGEIADLQDLLRRWLRIEEEPAAIAAPVSGGEQKAMQAGGTDRIPSAGEKKASAGAGDDMEDYLL